MKKENMTMGDILLRGRLVKGWGFVFRKLDVWLWPERTVSLSESERASPPGGIKSVVISHPVTWQKEGKDSD